MRLKHLQEQRGHKLKELEALNKSAEKRAFTEDEDKKFDALEAEIRAFDEQIKRAKSADELSREAEKEARERGEGGEDNHEQSNDDRLGLSAKEIRKYSLIDAINRRVQGLPIEGLEREASEAEARRLGRTPQGFFVPLEVLTSGAPEKRTQVAGVAADGGYLVGTEIDYANMVTLLRNTSHVASLGARVITGLRGDVSIPRQLTGATAYWVSETGTITSSKATFGQIQAKPRRIGSTVPYSKQLLAQSGLSVETFIREDITAAFGTELDRVAINGAGAAEPLGILNLDTGDRATSVTFGAAPTWAKVVEFETNVETANAHSMPGGQYAYLTTPGVKGAWKTTVKESGQATYLWEGDTVNGYAARSTNQVPDNKVIHGQFGQVFYFEWTGIDVVVDPLTLATSNQVKVTMQKHVDMVVRQGKGFSVSTDAGNQ